MKMDWLNKATQVISQNAIQAAKARQNQLTKPPGSLGRLEELAIRLAGMQNDHHPKIDNIHITLFAADHGVASEGVSAFPQSVTVEMIKNFAHGGAAISVLARQLDAQLKVINVGTINDHGVLDSVFDKRIGAGTANFCQQPAMSDNQLMEALLIGREFVEPYKNTPKSLFIGGEMGIANTTAATAITCALLDESPEAITGPGTGLDAKGISHKTLVIQKALDHHEAQLNSPLEILRRLGGFEIAALTGAYISCAQMGIPILVDGFISSVAALIAVQHNCTVADWMLFSHTSVEPGHAKVIRSLSVKPLLDLNMRLGEGSGAAVAVPQLQLACALHNNMATFGDANVSTQNSN